MTSFHHVTDDFLTASAEMQKQFIKNEDLMIGLVQSIANDIEQDLFEHPELGHLPKKERVLIAMDCIERVFGKVYAISVKKVLNNRAAPAIGNILAH